MASRSKKKEPQKSVKGINKNKNLPGNLEKSEDNGFLQDKKCENVEKADARLKVTQKLFLSLLAAKSANKQPLDNANGSSVRSSNEYQPNTNIETESIFKNYQTDLKESQKFGTSSSDEEEEYVEYVFRPRQYFLHSICQHCKNSSKKPLIPCEICCMTYYCSKEHMHQDKPKHLEFCETLALISTKRGGHIFNNTNQLSCEEYRAFRVSTLKACEQNLQRLLQPHETEVLLYPRLCMKPECREWRHNLLENCSKCSQVSYCVAHPEHLEISHDSWCKPFRLLREIICFQEKYGKVDPVLPSKVLTEPLEHISTISQVFGKLYNNLKEIGNVCLYSALTQIASPPLTIWFGLKMANIVQKSSILIHVIGAELQFEVDTLQKWEVFLLHIIPSVQQLNIVFVGPELNVPNVSFEALTKNKLCKMCRKNNRKIQYNFENALYHDYSKESSYQIPDLVCYFNPGLYRSTGFNKSDTWPHTIKATVDIKCPVIVTSYTQFECPLDLRSFLKESHRPLDIILPPTINPFRSQRPERNFISEENAPLIYKNFYFFILN